MKSLYSLEKRAELTAQAKKLRKQGSTIKATAEKLGVAESTMNFWLHPAQRKNSNKKKYKTKTKVETYDIPQPKPRTIIRKKQAYQESLEKCIVVMGSPMQIMEVLKGVM